MRANNFIISNSYSNIKTPSKLTISASNCVMIFFWLVINIVSIKHFIICEFKFILSYKIFTNLNPFFFKNHRVSVLSHSSVIFTEYDHNLWCHNILQTVAFEISWRYSSSLVDVRGITAMYSNTLISIFSIPSGHIFAFLNKPLDNK